MVMITQSSVAGVTANELKQEHKPFLKIHCFDLITVDYIIFNWLVILSIYFHSRLIINAIFELSSI